MRVKKILLTYLLTLIFSTSLFADGETEHDIVFGIIPDRIQGGDYQLTYPTQSYLNNIDYRLHPEFMFNIRIRRNWLHGKSIKSSAGNKFADDYPEGELPGELSAGERKKLKSLLLGRSSSEIIIGLNKKLMGDEDAWLRIDIEFVPTAFDDGNQSKFYGGGRIEIFNFLDDRHNKWPSHGQSIGQQERERIRALFAHHLYQDSDSPKFSKKHQKKWELYYICSLIRYVFLYTLRPKGQYQIHPGGTVQLFHWVLLRSPMQAIQF